jgi:hypothetical protein
VFYAIDTSGEDAVKLYPYERSAGPVTHVPMADLHVQFTAHHMAFFMAISGVGTSNGKSISDTSFHFEPDRKLVLTPRPLLRNQACYSQVCGNETASLACDECSIYVYFGIGLRYSCLCLVGKHGT